MASTSYSRIRDIADKHANDTCAHAYELHEETGVKRCLLGWMATDSGVRLPDEAYNTHVLGMRGTEQFIRDMRSEFGLSLDQLKQLQNANDDAENPSQFTELISGLIETWSARPGTESDKSP